MLSAEYLDSIRNDGERIIALAKRDPARPVPQYPGWAMSDLVNHLAAVHGRTTVICNDRPSERVPTPHLPVGADVVEWCQANLDEMLATLAGSDPDTSVWGFWPDPSIGLWERRMVVETGVHRWDAEQAFGEDAGLSDIVALSGLNEYADMWLPRLGVIAPLEVVATDLGLTWQFGDGAPEATVTGRASEIYLRLMSRPSSVTLPEAWAEAVDSLEPPSR